MRPGLDAYLDRGKLLLGVVHLKALPGSPRYDGKSIDELIALARADVDALLDAGFDGYVLENFGDVPFFAEEVPPHVVALLTRIACSLPRQEAFVAVNVLRNDAMAAVSVACAAELDAVRVNVHVGAMVTDQGVIEGKAAATTRLRARIAPHVAILADVAVKHATPLGADFDLAGTARDTAYRGLADSLIVTGPATGSPASLSDLETLRRAVPDRPLLVGSGIDEGNVVEALKRADGLIVGSAIKEKGRVDKPVDAARARRLVQTARG